MRTYDKPFRFPTEGQSSVVHNIALMQLGKVAGPVNDATVYIPCDMDYPQTVDICGLDSDTQARIAAGVHFNSLTMDTLATVVADATYDWATTTSYVEGQIVTDGADYAYICLESHTSGTFADDLADGYWQLINPKGFIKMTITPAASVQPVFTTKIVGY